MSTFANWLRSQLRQIDRLGEPIESTFDDMAMIVAEAGRRAARAGLPAAVEVCDIRSGGIAPSLARQILAECLAAVPQESTDGPRTVTVKQAAELLGVSVDSIYDLCSSGKLRHTRIGRTIRIAPENLDRIKEERGGARKLKYLG